jgi:hypothetical protein
MRKVTDPKKEVTGDNKNLSAYSGWTTEAPTAQEAISLARRKSLVTTDKLGPATGKAKHKLVAITDPKTKKTFYRVYSNR